MMSEKSTIADEKGDVDEYDDSFLEEDVGDVLDSILNDKKEDDDDDDDEEDEVDNKNDSEKTPEQKAPTQRINRSRLRATSVPLSKNHTDPCESVRSMRAPRQSHLPELRKLCKTEERSPAGILSRAVQVCSELQERVRFLKSSTDRLVISTLSDTTSKLSHLDLQPSTSTSTASSSSSIPTPTSPLSATSSQSIGSPNSSSSLSSSSSKPQCLPCSTSLPHNYNPSVTPGNQVVGFDNLDGTSLEIILSSGVPMLTYGLCGKILDCNPLFGSLLSTSLKAMQDSKTSAFALSKPGLQHPTKLLFSKVAQSGRFGKVAAVTFQTFVAVNSTRLTMKSKLFMVEEDGRIVVKAIFCPADIRSIPKVSPISSTHMNVSDSSSPSTGSSTDHINNNTPSPTSPTTK